MEILFRMEEHDYEEIVFCHDRKSGLKAIIVIHDTTLGPALGGTRMWDYQSEEEALEDAMRLARGMTYKNAAAGLSLGGGKTVIIGHPKRDKSPELFLALGKFIDRLNGAYITAEDVGTTVEDMDLIRTQTCHVVGTTPGEGSSGDPSPVTAYGIYKGIKAAAKEAFGNDSLKNKKIAVQGIGNVAFKLCEYLHNEGAKLIVTDINQEAINRAILAFNAVAVEPNDIYDVECDIYSPCALGATLNKDTIPRIRAKVIAGSANNQLKTSHDGDMIHKKGIIYAPDYVINSGGVINVSDELKGYNHVRAMNKVEMIYDNLLKVFEISRRDNVPTYLAADRMAEDRIGNTLNRRDRF